MNKKLFTYLFPTNLAVLTMLILTALWGSKAVTTVSENMPVDTSRHIIIDAGHGGVDGGATSCTGVLESTVNLEIALRLNDLMHLLGQRTAMIRTTDTSIYTEGNSIAAKKISDLKERVRIINETENALVISIHQNYFSDDRYSGAQVFYPKTKGSQTLARNLQTAFRSILNTGSKRQEKPASGVYLMRHINCTGVLIECGFLSNPQEEALLRNEEYQKKLCSVIAATISTFDEST